MRVYIHKKIIEELSSQIKDLENKQTEILKSIEEDKKEKMDTNDKDIAEKRRELDQLKTHYEETKFNHKNLEDKLKKEIDLVKCFTFSKSKKLANKRDSFPGPGSYKIPSSFNYISNMTREKGAYNPRFKYI